MIEETTSVEVMELVQGDHHFVTFTRDGAYTVSEGADVILLEELGVFRVLEYIQRRCLTKANEIKLCFIVSDSDYYGTSKVYYTDCYGDGVVCHYRKLKEYLRYAGKALGFNSKKAFPPQLAYLIPKGTYVHVSRQSYVNPDVPMLGIVYRTIGGHAFEEVRFE